MYPRDDVQNAAAGSEVGPVRAGMQRRVCVRMGLRLNVSAICRVCACVACRCCSLAEQLLDLCLDLLRLGERRVALHHLATLVHEELLEVPLTPATRQREGQTGRRTDRGRV